MKECKRLQKYLIKFYPGQTQQNNNNKLIKEFTKNNINTKFINFNLEAKY